MQNTITIICTKFQGGYMLHIKYTPLTPDRGNNYQWSGWSKLGGPPALPYPPLLSTKYTKYQVPITHYQVPCTM